MDLFNRPPKRTVAPLDMPVARRVAMEIKQEAVSAVGASFAPAPKPYAPPKPIAAAGASPIAMDDAYQSFAPWMAGGEYSPFMEGTTFMGYPYLAELSQRGEYRMGVETIAREMTRKWVKLKSRGGEDNSERIAVINAAMDRFELRAIVREALETEGYFGRSHIYPDTGFTNDPDRLALPLVLDPRTVKKGSLQGFKVIEPLWTYPQAYNATDPMDDYYYKPQEWFVMAKRVHQSRLFTLVGNEVPDILKPVYAFGGLSMTQMAKPYVDNWLRARQSVSDIMHSFSVSGIMTNLEGVLHGGGGQEMLARAALFNLARDNRGLMMLDKDTEEFFNVSTPLTTLDKLQAQAQEQLASIWGIPLVVLLGITPSGLNASSDGEIRVFYDRIHSKQEKMLRSPLMKAIRLIELSEFGDIDESITFDFLPLWQLDEAGQAAVEKTKIDGDVELINAGVVSPEEVRQKIAQDPESGYDHIDLSDPAPEPPDDGGEEGGGEIGRPEPREEMRSGV